MAKRMSIRVLMALVSMVIGWGFLLPDQAHAVPSFARQFGVPCAMCHVGFPKLNAFGINFKQAGYRMPGREAGDIWTEKFFPASGLVQIRYDRLMRQNRTTKVRTVDTSRIELHEAELMMAGTLAPKVSFFSEIEIETDDVKPEVGGGGNGELKLEAAWLVFDDVLGPPTEGRMNVKVGAFENEFFYLSAPRRLTRQGYLAPVSVEWVGAEVNGYLPVGLRYAVGLGNDERAETEGENVDAYFGWATYTLAGQAIGLRYINSKNNPENHETIDANLDFHFGPVNLIAAYFHQFNVGGVLDQDRDNYLVEAIFQVLPNLLLTGRFELQDTDEIAGANSGNDKAYIFNATYYTVPNVSIAAEYDLLRRPEPGTPVNENHYRLVLTYLF
jgi:hypothetical protein